MKKTWMRHAAAATALAAALALAAPVQASGWAQWASPSDFVHAVKHWIARLWAVPEGEDRPATQPGLEKAGPCIDPDGRLVPGCASQSTSGSPAGTDGR